MRTARSRSTGGWGARVVVAGMLGVDAVVHGQLAVQGWTGWRPVTRAQLFVLESTAAVLALVAVLVSARALVWVVAGLVLLGGLFAVVLTRYVDVPAVGPVPSMYEPLWYWQKTCSALAEGLGALAVVTKLRTFRGAGGRGRRVHRVVPGSGRRVGRSGEPPSEQQPESLGQAPHQGAGQG